MSEILRLPELGENVDSADLVAVKVAVGDRVELEQPLIEVETEKASVEVPAEAAGTIIAVHVKVGDQMKSGDPIVTLEPGESAAAEALSAAPSRVAEPESAALAPAPPRTPEVAAVPPSGHGRLIPAAPSVRRFAREVGVDLSRVKGSGPRGRLTMEDVKRTARGRLTVGQAGAPAAVLPDFSRWGEVAVEPMSKIRRLTAEQTARSAAQIPQVTHHDLADITDLEQLRARFAPRVEKAGGSLTLSAILVRVAATALRLHPKLNASVDMAGARVVLKRYVHIGVAVDTEHGLLVPVIRDADRLGITQIAVRLGDLAARARSRKLLPDELAGASFTISNLGGIGGTGFTPIVSWPEVGILGVSRARMQPEWDGSQFRPRFMLPLSLSYDHRQVDGADAARFLRFVCEALEQPLLLALEG